MNLTNPSLYPYLTTVRLVASGGPRGEQWGTGFFLDFRVDADQSSRWLITNKHIAEGATKIILRLHEGSKAGDGSVVISQGWGDLTIADPSAITAFHPTEDLCGISGLGIAKAVEQQGKVMAAEGLREDMIPTQAVLEAMDTLNEVIMIGYPAGRIDEANNLPILRQGVTASHPGVRFNQQSRGVIDATCYRGSSGSPILIWRDRLPPKEGQVLGDIQLWLIGVLVDYEMDNVSVTVTVGDAPTNPWASGTISKPLGLGKYIRAEELQVLKQTIRAGGRLI